MWDRQTDRQMVTWTGNTHNVVYTCTHSTIGDRDSAAAGPGLWNSLPPHLRDTDLPYSRFRRSLKTFLFGSWGHGAVRTILTVPSRNNLTYLLTFIGRPHVSVNVCVCQHLPSTS